MFFFFQAEDGIRDVAVTGVQTCALPIFVDRDRKLGETTVSEVQGRGRKAVLFSADVSKGSEVQRLIPQIVAEFGGLDVLVSNAGIQRYGTATSASEAEWDEVLNINLKSAFLMSKHAIPEMIRRGGGGLVVTRSGQAVAGPPQ